MTRVTKYLTAHVLQGQYGTRWEDVTEEDSRKEILIRLREYRDNEPYPFRVIRRRVPNPAYADDTPPRYTVTLRFRDRDTTRTVARGLTLAAAQAMCADESASSSTCTCPTGAARTARYGPWMYTYDEQ